MQLVCRGEGNRSSEVFWWFQGVVSRLRAAGEQRSNGGANHQFMKVRLCGTGVDLIYCNWKLKHPTIYCGTGCSV